MERERERERERSGKYGKQKKRKIENIAIWFVAYSIPCLASGVIISRGGRTPLTVLLRANISSPLATYLVCICIVLMKIYLYCCLLIVVGEGLQPNNRVDKRDRIKELKLRSIKAYCCCCSTRGATVHKGEKSLSCIASRLLQLLQYTR